MRRLDKKLGIRDARAEATTVAMFAVMNKLMSTVVPPQLQLNVDGSQFVWAMTTMGEWLSSIRKG